MAELERQAAWRAGNKRVRLQAGGRDPNMTPQSEPSRRLGSLLFSADSSLPKEAVLSQSIE